MGAGVTVMGLGTYGNFVTIASNSTALKGVPNNVLIAGVPGEIKKEGYPAWYDRDGLIWKSRVDAIENLFKSE